MVTFELRAERTREVIGVNAPEFLEHYSTRRERIMKDNLLVTINQRQNELNCAHWMNNDCDTLHKEVQLQYTKYCKTLAENMLIEIYP